ncbi:MAG: metal-dependent transcriptional regulator [Clostridiales bacterium]|nr:metal-dependent transcriptional regulator [Clostridiales bacterium]
MEGLYESGEDYLETILILYERKGSVRSVDIARELDLSKPSVSRAVGILKEKKLITIEEDGSIKLTKNGKSIATRIYDRHRVLSRALILLGVDETTASEEACRIEHDISESTFRKIKEHVEQHDA